MQTRKGSLVEIATNITAGFITSMVVNFYLLPQYGCQVSHEANFQITVVFTVISIIRSYFFRRMFNRIAIRFKF